MYLQIIYEVFFVSHNERNTPTESKFEITTNKSLGTKLAFILINTSKSLVTDNERTR